MSFKRISLFGLLLTVSFLNAQLRIVADLAGSHDADSYVKLSSGGYSEDESDSFSADTDIGITVGYDLMLSDAMGVGVEYQMNRGASDGAEKLGKFGFTSVYGVAKFTASDNMYGVARIGYALMWNGDNKYMDDDGLGIDYKGGMMYSIGGGMKINEKMSVEAGYSSNAGNASYSGREEGYDVDLTADIIYTRLSVGLVYSF